MSHMPDTNLPDNGSNFQNSDYPTMRLPYNFNLALPSTTTPFTSTTPIPGLRAHSTRPAQSAHAGHVVQAGTSSAAGLPLDMNSTGANPPGAKPKKSRRNADPSSQKRRCVSTACVACRKRKSKCDGAMPSCAACSSVYYTECVYDPNSDHRRKGVYRDKVDSMKAKNSTLQILIEAILNAEEEDVPDIVSRIRTCDSLDSVAESIVKGQNEGAQNNGGDGFSGNASSDPNDRPEGERELARRMGELRLENGSVRFIGGTSHLIYTGESDGEDDGSASADLSAGNAVAGTAGLSSGGYLSEDDALRSWTQVTTDVNLIRHLMKMYFNWHYPYFATLSKNLFERDFLLGRPAVQPKRTAYCSSLLVNAMLALGCHFSGIPGAFGTPGDDRTKGDHFFAEAKRLIVENDEYEKPRLVTVQALALMSVREAGCAREAKGWVYSGMSFRMAQDIGLTFDTGGGTKSQSSITGNEQNRHQMDEGEVDARRITFWGCFLFDKAWSNYLGRLPQLPMNSYNVPKYDVFPNEDSAPWSPYTDTGYSTSLQQPSRTRAIGLQLSKLCEISSDILLFFYHPNHIGRSHSKALELRKLSELQRRLENWHAELPKELEAKDGQLPNMMLTHMFYHLQYIHLFRPFLKYSPKESHLPSHISPRRYCTAHAGAISKLMRQYKKAYNLRQICNIAVYMIHSACTIHLLNLPEKTAKRNIIHGVKHLEEIAADWPCARRTLGIISVLARKWEVDLPDEASQILQRTDEKYGTYNTSDVPSPLRPLVTDSATHSAASGSPHDSTNSSRAFANHKTEHPGPTIGVPNAAVTGFMDQYSHQSPSFQDYTTPGLTPEYLRAVPKVQSPTSSGLDAIPKQHLPQGFGVNAANNGGVPLAGHNLHHAGAWAMPQGVAAANTSTYQAHLGLQQAGPQPDALQNMYGVDTPDFFLKDGVNWHHNFEAWGLAPQQTPSPETSSQAHHAQLHNLSGANTGTGSSNGDSGAAHDPTYYGINGAQALNVNLYDEF
ncbi:nitrogen assimilation transcription factor nit-4 [Ophiostoma piceae UAMH 11346]|uniref:Nitrogen assimilation transcription factor nit-4 n=1 Tax=Ophiostoma piceae (strain UAMH 11346) TaxID=1262450 RepID=S3CYT8_OPHP1|nr:nitrogen assimilation transcription factor nit-4 [Ophiostoma piceae UAMH 11346]